MRTITATVAGEERIRAVLQVGTTHTVALNPSRERHSDLLRRLKVTDIG